jgi:hypothetical protein
MVPEFKFGQTMPSTKENGAKTKPTVEASSGMLMEISMKVSGKMIRPMDTVSIFMLMALNMKVTGRTISKTAKEWNPGKMEVAMKVDTKKE